MALPLIIRQTGGDRFIAAANRRKPPGHTGKGVGKGPDGGDTPYIDPDDGDVDNEGGGVLPATGGGAVLLGLLTFSTGLLLRRRRRDQEPSGAAGRDDRDED